MEGINIYTRNCLTTVERVEIEDVMVSGGGEGDANRHLIMEDRGKHCPVRIDNP